MTEINEIAYDSCANELIIRILMSYSYSETKMWENIKILGI